MNQDGEKRMMLAFVITFIMIGALMFFNKPKAGQEPQAQAQNQNQSQAVSNTTPVKHNIPEIKVLNKAKAQSVTLNYGNQINLKVSTLGGYVDAININGDWNRHSNAVSLVAKQSPIMNNDFFIGDTSTLMTEKERPVYSILEKSSNSLTISADMLVKRQKLRVIRTYTLSSNYQIFEKITLRNLSSSELNLDRNGKAFTLATVFEPVKPDQTAGRNMLYSIYYKDGKKQTALKLGLIARFSGKKLKDTIVKDPAWMSLYDNYFVTAVIPQSPGFTGHFKQIKTLKKGLYKLIAMNLEAPATSLAPQESKSYDLLYYTGPRKVGLVSKASDSMKTIFSWPAVFAWFMWPIEWLIIKGMYLLSLFIANWGIVVILLALMIKLLLAPLSIKSAVSIKRMNLLQPKLKNIQEKYKGDQKKLQEKTMELYKKEGVNPLGGCLPMLLQIPVFFALYRVLATSVELRGANFLWIKDLTQPDTLFTITLFGGPFHFNLLPLIMTGIQLIQTKLQSTNNPTMGKQGQMNMYLLPLIFLFLFWNMPSGLVLYWTVQNLYTIIEQFVINRDKYVKLV